MDTDQHELLTVGEAAELLSLSTQTLKRWEGPEFIEPIRTPGGHRRYRKSDVDAILEQRTAQQAARS